MNNTVTEILKLVREGGNKHRGYRSDVLLPKTLLISDQIIDTAPNISKAHIELIQKILKAEEDQDGYHSNFFTIAAVVSSLITIGTFGATKDSIGYTIIALIVTIIFIAVNIHYINEK